ncbi:MAG TPA: serine hydrolase domain-containing protein [Gemmatimonadales bacterium]|nr:serine hydrolase domain-containing protein [Gemmatimonadales bacterium]
MARLTALTALIVWPALLHSQHSTLSPRAGLRSTLDSVVEATARRLPLAGVSVLAMHGEDTLVAHAAGYADLENRVPASLGTVYQISSLTKQFTAAAILQLVERGAIRLEDDIGKYVPEYSRQKKPVTILQLLNHSSGIRDFDDIGDRFWDLAGREVPQREVLSLIRDQPYDFAPGTRWYYSNTGYYLLGVLLERVTGRTYADYIRDQVARPAGLTGTNYCDRRQLLANRARGYDAVGADFLNAPRMSSGSLSASTGLCSTVRDLVAWSRALQSGKVVSRESYRLMTTPVGSAARADPPYGFGLWVINHEGKQYISHLGQIGGFSAVLSTSSDSIIIAVLTNTSGPGAISLGQQLGAVIRQTPPPPVEGPLLQARPQRRPLTPAERKRYAGRYEMRDIREDGSAGSRVLSLDVLDENGRLVAQLTGDPVEELVRVDHDRFVGLLRPDLEFRFTIRRERADSVAHQGPYGQYKGPRVRD